MTGRPMETGNLEQIEFLKGPASLLSGEGATGGAVNYVTKRPHTGPIINEAFTSYDCVHRLPRRLWLRRQHRDQRARTIASTWSATMAQLHRRHLQPPAISPAATRLPRSSNDFKVWGAAEYKEDKDRFYWGTPLVPANGAGIVPTSGIVSGIVDRNVLLERSRRPAESRHHRRPDAEHHLQRARQPQRRQGALAAHRVRTGTSTTMSSSRASSTTTSQAPLVQQRDQRLQRRSRPASTSGRSIASGSRSITTST